MNTNLVHTVADLFEQYKNTPADINEHLQFLHDLCVDNYAQTVVELGVRGGMSTTAFLTAMEKTEGTLYSFDINPPTTHPLINTHPRWKFTQGDDTKPEVFEEVPNCDVLFIDTSHAYAHTLLELMLYAPLALQYVVLHDTQLEQPEAVGPQPPFPVMKAIQEYPEDNLDWDFIEYTHNNGLGVMARKDTA